MKSVYILESSQYALDEYYTKTIGVFTNFITTKIKALHLWNRNKDKTRFYQYCYTVEEYTLNETDSKYKKYFRVDDMFLARDYLSDINKEIFKKIIKEAQDDTGDFTLEYMIDFNENLKECKKDSLKLPTWNPQKPILQQHYPFKAIDFYE